MIQPLIVSQLLFNHPVSLDHYAEVSWLFKNSRGNNVDHWCAFIGSLQAVLAFLVHNQQFQSIVIQSTVMYCDMHAYE